MNSDGSTIWDQRYTRDDYLYGTEPNGFLLEHVGTIRGERVLAIVSIFVHLPSPLQRQVHRRMVRALAPGGVILLEGTGHRGRAAVVQVIARRAGGLPPG